MDAINKVNKKLSSKFDMKYLGVANFFMGMEIKRDQYTRKIKLNKMKYIETILK